MCCLYRNSIEAELETQKEEYLQALSKVRSLSESLRKKDTEMNDRVSELLEESANKDSQIKKLTADLEDKNKALEETEGELIRSRSSYVTKAKELDHVYTEKIQMLLDRVESLESKGKTFLDTRDRTKTGAKPASKSTFLTEAIDSAPNANSRRVRSSGPTTSGSRSRLNQALKARDSNSRIANTRDAKLKQANQRRSNYNHQQMRFVATGINNRHVKGLAASRGFTKRAKNSKSALGISDPKLFGPR